MELPQYPTHSDCEKCGLHASVRNVGLATLCVAGGKDAIVWIGQNPGMKEDQYGEVFVGDSGALLRGGWFEGNRLVIKPASTKGLVWCDGGYLGFEPPGQRPLQERAAHYLTNTVRCACPASAPPGWKEQQACSAWLEADLRDIVGRHERVAFVALGGHAANVVVRLIFRAGKENLTAKKAFELNGSVYEWEGKEVAFFCTYNPAAVTRQPNFEYDAENHLILINDWLEGTLAQPTEPTFIKACSPKGYK